jgi:MFS transporter, SHS family, lactate transporter
MGAEWPAGAALAMETWPQRSRGLMGSVLQGSWGLGALLSSAAYGLLYDSIGWRGLLLIGVLPALVIVYIRKYVREPEIWIENRRKQRLENREFRAPLFSARCSAALSGPTCRLVEMGRQHQPPQP